MSSIRKLLVALLIAGCHEPGPGAPATGGQPVMAPTAPATAPIAPAAGATPEALAAPSPAPAAAPVTRLPAKVRIIVRSVPPKAWVRWGKKALGQTPVTLERPRESGPVDLVVRADGYFPLHTRAYSFRNDIFTVRLTKLGDRMTLFGAKAELPPEPSPAPMPP